MGSGCGQGWRGCAGRGSSRRLGRSGQQRGGGLAGAHWSMLNGGADEADRERQQVKDAPLLGGWLQKRQAGRKVPALLPTEQDLPEVLSPGSGKEYPHPGPQDGRAQTTGRSQ